MTLLLSCQHFTSGIGRYSFELGSALRQFDPGLRLAKVARNDHPDAHFHRDHSWIQPVPYKSFRDLHPYILPFFLRRAIRPSRHRIIHAHWFLSGLAATLLNPDTPVVITMHDVSLLHVLEKNGLYTRWYRYALDRFREREVPVITVSETARRDALEFAGFRPDQVHAVWNGINHDQFSYREERPDGPPTVVYSGGLGPRKNLGLLLQAWQQIEQEFPDARLRIAGAWPERTAYPQQAAALGLRNVTFTGYIPDEAMARFYHEAHLMVFTSEYEGFGFAPLEAMACGTPVITTTGGALAETAAPAALTVSYQADDVAGAIRSALSSPSLRASLQRRGRAWASQFSWERTAARTRDVYKTAGMR